MATSSGSATGHGSPSLAPEHGMPTGIPPEQFRDIFQGFGAQIASHPSFLEKTEDRYPEKDLDTYTAFEKQYQPDRFGDEASDNARVWRLYRDRVTELDADLIRGWDDTLTTLLVFAGLFSAAVTAFLIEVSQQLQPDYGEYTNKAVLAIVAHLNGTTMGPSESLQPYQYQATASLRAINTLWFTSLTLALSVSLFAILVKQWLVEFNARMRRPTESRRLWARRHAIYREGFDAWHLGAFISALPFLLHIALFLFLDGLLVWLFELDLTTFVVVLSLTAVIAIFYAAATIAPLFYGECPSFTPLLEQLFAIFRNIATWPRSCRDEIYILCRRCFVFVLNFGFRLTGFGWLKPTPFYGLITLVSPLGKPAYLAEILDRKHPKALDAEILAWMVANLFIPEDVHVALDALGSCLDANKLHSSNRSNESSKSVQAATSYARLVIMRHQSIDRLETVARAVKTVLALKVGSYISDVFGTSAFQQLCSIDAYDLSLLLRCMMSCNRSGSVDLITLRASPAALAADLRKWSSSGGLPALPSTLSILLRDMYWHSADERWDLITEIGLQLAASLDSQLDAQAETIDLAAQFADLVYTRAQVTFSLLNSETDHRIIHVLGAWSVIITFSDQFPLSTERLGLISQSYIKTMELCASFGDQNFDHNLLILSLACLRPTLKPGADSVLIQSWTQDSQLGALKLLDLSSTTSWSILQADVLFNLLDWFIAHPILDARHYSFQYQYLGRCFVSEIRSDPHHYVVDFLRRQPSVMTFFLETHIRCLLGYTCSDGRSRASFNLALSVGIGTYTHAWNAVVGLCQQLSVWGRLGLNTEEFFNNLLSEDLILRYLPNDGNDSAFTVARHAKEFVPTWWERIQACILADLVQYPTGEEFVRRVNEAKPCRNCARAASQGRRILKANPTAWDMPDGPPLPHDNISDGDGLLFRFIRSIHAFIAGKPATEHDIELQVIDGTSPQGAEGSSHEASPP